MSELCNPENHFSSLLISDLILLCSSILSHPLYLSYFIFFSPYLLKLLSFLSPLFFTTLLLSLALLTGLVESSQFSPKTLLVIYISARQKFGAKRDLDDGEDSQGLEDLGLYEILFGPTTLTEDECKFSKENPGEIPVLALESGRPENPGMENVAIAKTGDVCKVEKNPGMESLAKAKTEDVCKVEKIPGMESVAVAKTEDVCKAEKNPGSGERTRPVMEEKRLENFLKILDEFERMASSASDEKKRVPPLKGGKTDKAVEKQKSGWAQEKNGSEGATCDKISCAASSAQDGKNHTTSLLKSRSQRMNSSVDSLGTYGSMRKEKEWKRTLACKLFEERHNVGGVEGMDSLWETYEMDSNKATAAAKNTRERKVNERKKKKSEIEVFEDEEIDHPTQLCCLQALKLSAGKMNMGMGRPNLVKISKAIKGFGWLHGVTKSKKVHNSNGERY